MNPSQSTPTNTPQIEPIGQADELESVLAGLKENLKTQHRLLEEENYDAFLALGDDIAIQLQRITVSKAPYTPASFDHVRQIQTLHRQLGLTIATRSEETGQKLAKMRTGKQGLKAYRNGLGT